MYMYNVLYVSKLACNLFSVRAAASKGNFITFGHSRCWIRDNDGKLHGMETLVDSMGLEKVRLLPADKLSGIVKGSN